VFVPASFVALPRGIAIFPVKDTYVASGTNPATGERRNTTLRFDATGRLDDVVRYNFAEVRFESTLSSTHE
jgi:hypothetical protein